MIAGVWHDKRGVLLSSIHFLVRASAGFMDTLVGAALLFCLAILPAGASSTEREPSRNSDTSRFERPLEEVQPLLDRYGYGAAAATVMAEGVGIPMPGQTLLMASAAEAAAGRMNIGLVLLVVALAASVGNSLGYWIGRWGGQMVLDRFKLNPQRRQRIDDLFRRRGGLVILFARFLDGLRQLNGIVAGVVGMPWWSFTAYNVAGAILWTCSWGLATYYLGRDIHFIAAFLHRHEVLLYLLGAAGAVLFVLYWLRSKRSAG